MTLSRREWLRLTATATGGALVAGVSACGEQNLAPFEDPEEGHLVSRPGAPVFTPQLGVNALGIGGTRDGLRFVPTTFRPGEALPLLVTLHGAGGNAYSGIQPFLAFAESARVVLVSPDSRNVSWDRRYGGFGVDSRFLDNALSDTYLRCAIDPTKIAIAGFSDGASYALSLGLTNGDLFRQIVAFSPGFMVPNVSRGKPTVFDSHGTRDTVLPIATTSRVFVPKLQAAGYQVTYREFDGTHQIPVVVAEEAFGWLRAGWGE
ncbi:MAG: phospholipase [Gemmatimonadaceae bacterium]|nr:phospholipase [Gemmatimonadaceae bacterium]